MQGKIREASQGGDDITDITYVASYFVNLSAVPFGEKLAVIEGRAILPNPESKRKERIKAAQQNKEIKGENVFVASKKCVGPNPNQLSTLQGPQPAGHCQLSCSGDLCPTKVTGETQKPLWHLVAPPQSRNPGDSGMGYERNPAWKKS